MTRPYLLTKGAEADLHNITHYTVAQWGVERCRTYIAALAVGKVVFKAWRARSMVKRGIVGNISNNR